MADKDPAIDQIMRQTFGEKADLGKVKTVGSGISETQRISLNVLHQPDMLHRLPAPWSQNLALIAKLFTPIFARSRQCPGRERPQCCRADGTQACHPNWREREDPEWYAQRINLLLSQVNDRILQEGPCVAALAADEAFELGRLLTEALIKFEWDVHAVRGKKTADSARAGGEAKRDSNPKRKSPDETVAAVDAQLATGVSKRVAYLREAKAQGVSEQTVRKEYCAAKKER